MAKDNLDPNADNQDPDATTATVDWREGLDVGIKEHPSLQNFKNPGDLAKSWVEAQKLIGRDKIPVPGEKATKEDWDMVFDRLGRPKTPDAYGVAVDKIQFPNGYPKPKEDFISAYKNKAHELGLLPTQVSNLFEWFMGTDIDRYNQILGERNDARLSGETALRKLWGAAYEQNLMISEQVINKFANERLITKLKHTNLNNDPDMIEFISGMAKNFSEDKIAGRPLGLTLAPEEAMAKIASIKAQALKDKNHPLNDKRHPEHDLFIKEWENLHKQAFPDNA